MYKYKYTIFYEEGKSGYECVCTTLENWIQLYFTSCYMHALSRLFLSIQLFTHGNCFIFNGIMYDVFKWRQIHDKEEYAWWIDDHEVMMYSSKNATVTQI